MKPYIVYSRTQVKAGSPEEAHQYVADALYDRQYVCSVVVDTVLDGTPSEQYREENA